MSKQDKKAYAIQSVNNAFDLLEQFHGNDVEFGVSDLSRRMNLTKNNIFRLLSTLKSRDFIEQNQQTEKYRLGFKNIELRRSVVRHLKRFDYSRPILEAMARECNETVCYSVFDNFDVITMDAIECDHPLRVSPRIGVLLPSYCTAAGKVMLAGLADDELGKYLTCCQFVQRTPSTVTDSVQLRKQLQQIVRDGYAVEREESDVGVSSVGTVIRDYTHRTVGAVTLVGPSERLSDDRLNEQLIPLLLEVAAKISCKLGSC
jgi:IclR family KDG regulon transcriptional repressor